MPANCLIKELSYNKKFINNGIAFRFKNNEIQARRQVPCINIETIVGKRG